MPIWRSIQYYQKLIYKKWQVCLSFFTRTKRYLSVMDWGIQIISTYPSYMPFDTSWTMFNQEGHLIIFLQKCQSHYTLTCVRCPIMHQIIVSLTSRYSITWISMIIWPCSMHTKNTGCKESEGWMMDL